MDAPLPPGFQLDPALSQQMGTPVAVNAEGKRIRWKGGAQTNADGLKPAPPEWGAGAFVLPNGEVRRRGPRGGFEKLGEIPGAAAAGVTPDIKEFQSNAAARATLMDQGLKDYESARADGYDPSTFKNTMARGLEGDMVGNYLADVFRDNPSERGRAAELQFTDGALRTTSGANAPEPEVVRANKAYFRQPGESVGVEPNRSELRRRFRDQSVRIAGPAYIPPQPGEKAKPVPSAARQAHIAFTKSSEYSADAPLGSEKNPYVARDDATARKLPAGTYVILSNGSLARKDR